MPQLLENQLLVESESWNLLSVAGMQSAAMIIVSED